jgi:hypothetical protein
MLNLFKTATIILCNENLRPAFKKHRNAMTSSSLGFSTKSLPQLDPINIINIIELSEYLNIPSFDSGFFKVHVTWLRGANDGVVLFDIDILAIIV